MNAWQRFKYGPAYRWLPWCVWRLLCRSTWRRCSGCGRRWRFKRSMSSGGGRPARFYCDVSCRPPEDWWT